MNQQIVNEWFGILASLLKGRQLDCEDGSKREATAAEFMLMQIRPVWNGRNGADFKHRFTRNYVYVTIDKAGQPSLEVPKTDKLYNKGVFDWYPEVVPS